MSTAVVVSLDMTDADGFVGLAYNARHQKKVYIQHVFGAYIRDPDEVQYGQDDMFTGYKLDLRMVLQEKDVKKELDGVLEILKIFTKNDSIKIAEVDVKMYRQVNAVISFILSREIFMKARRTSGYEDTFFFFGIGGTNKNSAFDPENIKEEIGFTVQYSTFTS